MASLRYQVSYKKSLIEQVKDTKNLKARYQDYDSMAKILTIFDNFGNPVRSYHVGKYFAIFPKIRQYCTISGNIDQHLSISNNF